MDYGEGAGAIAITLNPGNSFSLSNIYTSEGTFTVSITINDGSSDGTETLSVIVDDESPVSNPGGPYTTNEGTSITLDASGSSDNGSIVSYEWDLDDDGLFDDATGVTTSALFNDDSILGPYIVGLRVTDNDGFSSISTVGVFVNNVIPALVVNPGPTTIDEGTTFSGAGFFTDPGNDVFSASVDYGDGTDVDMTLPLNPDKTFDLSHTYTKDGVYSVIVTVSDSSKDGTVTETFDVTVTNIAPTVVPGTGGAVSEGDSFSTSGSFIDPGEDDWVITVDFGDGSVPDIIAFDSGKNFDIEHAFANDGTYDIVVSVDDGFETTTESLSVLVINVPPDVDAGPDGTINEGSEFSSVGFVTDPGDESYTATVDFGDGSGITPLTINDDRSFELAHTYENNGVYSVLVLVDDGDSGSDGVLVTVNNVVPKASIDTSSVDENRKYTAQGTFTDPGSDAWTAEVDYGDGTGTSPLTLNPDKSFSLEHTFSTNGAYTITISINDGDDSGTLSRTVGIFVNQGGPASGLNSPTPSSASVSDSIVFETDDQDIWGTGSSKTTWNLFTPQSWNPSNAGFSEFTKLAGKKLGIGMDAGTKGHLKMFAGVDDLKGTVDVNYPGDVALIYAGHNSFLADQTVDVSSAWQLDPSAMVDGKTTGDLQLDLDMKLDTFLDSEACLLDGCTDIFSIPRINFDTHPSATTLFVFDDDNPINSVPDFVQRALLKSNAKFSSIDVKPDTSSVNTVTGTVVAEDTNLFSTMDIDIDKIFTTLLTKALGCPSFPAPPCVTLGDSLSIDKTTLAFDYFDATSDIDFIAEQKLTFDTDVLIKLDFERPVSGVLGSFVDVTSNADGDVTSVTYRSGQSISVTFPEGQTEPITVTPTALLDPSNTKLHNFAKVTTDSDVTMSAGYAKYSIQSFQVSPPITISYPHILGHWHCHDRYLRLGHNYFHF